MAARAVAELDFERLRTSRPAFHPSPTAWEDEVLYFLLLDRFSDGREDGYRDADGTAVAGATPLFAPADAGNAVATEADAALWRAAGARWTGGTLAGATTKLGYLRRLGVTALWISPIFKQVTGEASYHGYGVQDFLVIDPHFGTVDDLKALVDTAHVQGIRVILDIILNHTGDVFAYDADRYDTPDGRGGTFRDPRWDGRPYAVAGFRDEQGEPRLPFAPVDLEAQPAPSRDGGVWPAELYRPQTFTQKGHIDNWDYPAEYLEGDFESLKNVTLGTGAPDDYAPSAALLTLTRAYQYWIAEADLDGFRVDTVKHMDAGATRFFASAVHEFAQSLGKERFYLIGEITGGRAFAYDTLETTGLDAALGIDDVPGRLEGFVRGEREPSEYFDLFRNSLLVGKESHAWFRDKVVTVIDDHDQVRKGESKARLCADPDGRRLALAMLGLNATTLGIPCVYYGSEQALDGAGGNDRYIRESMFGGDFGPFRSHGRHVFDEQHPLYRELAKVLALRRARLVLRRGRQYLREVSGDGASFGLPRRIDGRMRSLVPWSRILATTEMLLATNTDPDAPTTAWARVDADLHTPGEQLRCAYSSDPAQTDQQLPVELRGGGNAVRLTVPPAGLVVFE